MFISATEFREKIPKLWWAIPGTTLMGLWFSFLALQGNDINGKLFLACAIVLCSAGLVYGVHALYFSKMGINHTLRSIAISFFLMEVSFVASGCAVLLRMSEQSELAFLAFIAPTAAFVVSIIVGYLAEKRSFLNENKNAIKECVNLKKLSFSPEKLKLLNKERLGFKLWAVVITLSIAGSPFYLMGELTDYSDKVKLFLACSALIGVFVYLNIHMLGRNLARALYLKSLENEGGFKLTNEDLRHINIYRKERLFGKK